MESLLIARNLRDIGLPMFYFAGMQFPKYVWTLPQGTMQERIKRRSPVVCGDYYHSPTPIGNGLEHSVGFYLDSDGAPGLRWTWCDELDERIGHTGWFTEASGDGDNVRGIVMRLPHGRGHLAGWSMGIGMASCVVCCIYEGELEAARAADHLAEEVAENERSLAEDDDDES